MNEKRREQGQVLVLIILAIVGIMGVIALGVDGGLFYSERRRAQSAADAAAYAAAFTAQMGGNWEAEATEQLVLNGYGDTDISDNGLPIDVMIYNPPLNAADYEPAHEYFQVIIRTKVNPVFSQFVYNGPLSMTVEAVTRATNYNNAVVGQAMVSTGKTECDSMKFHTAKKNTTRVIGGGIYANSNACSGNCKAIGADGSSVTLVTDGTITTAGCIDYGNGSFSADGGTTEKITQLPMPTIPDPDCSHLPNRTFDKDNPTLLPGNYTNEIKITNGSFTMASGMYCLNHGLNANGGQLLGNKVFLVIKGGDVEIGGNTTVHLTASDNLLDGATPPNQWANMLIHMPYSNTGVISLSGGGNSHYTGTIYAPGPSNKTKCTILGNSDAMAVNSSLICYSVEVGGAADVTIIYRKNQNYIPPARLELSK
jgi:hypothetical protein